MISVNPILTVLNPIDEFFPVKDGACCHFEFTVCIKLEYSLIAFT